MKLKKMKSKHIKTIAVVTGLAAIGTLYIINRKKINEKALRTFGKLSKQLKRHISSPIRKVFDKEDQQAIS